MHGFPRLGQAQKSGRAARLAVAMLFGLWCGGALADQIAPTGGAVSGKEPMTFQADEGTNDEQLGVTVAKGHVEIAQGTQILLADVVTYNQRTDTVTASGNVSLMLQDGSVLFSQYMELRNSM